MTAPDGPIASVVIPAHNEAAVLTRCLDRLLRDGEPGEFDIVVVANGCHDDTAELARRYDGVRVIETTEASKSLALNVGDRAVHTAVRIFLDADVTISADAARALARVLDDSGPVRAAAPRIRVDDRRSSAPARAYLRVWSSLPVFDTAYVGSGCYALSAAGRSRFADFPDEIADDRYINRLFAAAEKRTLPDHFTAISAPRTLRGVIRRSVRVQLGSRVMDGSAAGDDFADGPSAASSRAHLVSLLRDRRRVLDVGVYISTHIVVTVMARYRLARRAERVWLRDDTSRSPD